MVTRSQYRAIKYSLTRTEKSLIAFYELEWFLRHRVPTVEEVHEHLRKALPNIRQTSVNYYLTRQPVIKALEDRGIPWRQHSQAELTDQQRAAALTVLNFADERSVAEKLDAIGILPATYYAWLNDPIFKNFVETLAEQNKKNIRPQAITELAKKVQQGDWNAVKFYLEVTGEFAAKSDSPNSETLIRMLIEIIQKHVKDPATITAIAQDIKLASANRTLEVAVEQPALTSHVIEDVEVVEARKKLGI